MSKTAAKSSKKVAAKKTVSKQATPATRKTAVKAKPAGKVKPVAKKAAKKALATKAPAKKAAKKPAVKKAAPAKKSVAGTKTKPVQKKPAKKSAPPQKKSVKATTKQASVKQSKVSATTTKGVVKAAATPSTRTATVKSSTAPKSSSRSPSAPAASPSGAPSSRTSSSVSPVSSLKVSQLSPASTTPTQASGRNAEAQLPVPKPPLKMLATAPKPAKVDPKLANAWKTKSGRDLTDAELLAMPDSEYMNEHQQDFFKARLEALKDDLLSNAGETTEHLREDTSIVPDPADRATIEEEHALELRTRDRERKLLKKISQALARLESGDYGYCDETGEPIGLGRLIARPTATLSLEAQQRRELKQRMFGD